MKKIISALLTGVIFVALCSCSQGEKNTIKIFSCIGEYDVKDFSFEEFFSALKMDEEVSIEEKALEDSEKNDIKNRFYLVYDFRCVIIINYCHNVESAKSLYRSMLKDVVSQRLLSPYSSLIRINDVVISPLQTSESNAKMNNVMSLTSIDDNLELEIETIFLKKPKKTGKTVEEVIKCMEEKGYELIYEDKHDDSNISEYAFLSTDKINVYHILSSEGVGAKLYVRTIIKNIKKFTTSYENPQLYYSMHKDSCMVFVGYSSETLELWDSIRK